MRVCDGFTCDSTPGMSPEEYTRLALRTAPGDSVLADDDDEKVILTRRQYRLLLGAIGLCGEAGEVAEMVKKHVFHEHPLDTVKLEKELGDVSWYHNYLTVRGIRSTLRQVWATNIAKLKARYPSGEFKAEESLNRRPGDV